MTDWKPLQQRLGVTADGIIGRNTLRALFARFGANPARAGELALAANVHLRAHDILTPQRLAHFMAQVAHESGGFKWMEEIWGPTKQQQGYEGRRDLGNIVPGDGFRFKGRGPIQLTGRANYKAFGQIAGIDFENNPEIVALPSVGLMVAAMFWAKRDLNALADADDVEAVTRRINGGLNGLDSRKLLLAKGKELLA